MNILPDRHLTRVADIEQIAAVPNEPTISHFNEALGLFKPLKLEDVLRRVEALHVACTGGGHVCGLPARLIKLDLYQHFLVPQRAYINAQRG